MRPLLICDCDEVILHMVAHFRDWLGEDHEIEFDYRSGRWADAMRYRIDDRLVPEEKIWPLLEGFFEAQMHRQTLAPGARDALERLAPHGDIVILTNIGERNQAARQAQLEKLGIAHEVVASRGGKGRPVMKILQRFNPSHAVFVDDLPVQHGSVAKHAPRVKRLHMVAEPRLAPAVPTAEAAHARIDEWDAAARWILEQWEVT